MAYSLKQFIRDGEKIVRKNSQEEDILRGLKPLLEDLIATPDSIPQDAFKPKKDESYVPVNLIYQPKDKMWSVIGTALNPNQVCPIHDHLIWALVGILGGAENEWLYRRTDDGSNPKIAKLERMLERTNQPGSVVTHGGTAIHAIGNPFNDRTITSLHVYGNDLGGVERHMYDPVTGEVKKFTSGYCNVLPDPDQY